MKTTYPEKEVLIVETGYIWTNESADEANNIISEVHPDFSPASPVNQRDWLIELAKEVMAKEGLGVIYWEPSWVSTPCSTQWGQGSHQEHATFFDFENNLLLPGGIEWMEYDYGLISNTDTQQKEKPVDFEVLGNGSIQVVNKFGKEGLQYSIIDSMGRVIQQGKLGVSGMKVDLRDEPQGHYTLSVGQGQQLYTLSFINLK